MWRKKKRKIRLGRWEALMEVKGMDGKIRQVALIRANSVRGLGYRPVGWVQRQAALEL